MVLQYPRGCAALAAVGVSLVRFGGQCLQSAAALFRLYNGNVMSTKVGLHCS